MDKILFCFFLTRGLLSWALAEHTLKIDKIKKHDLKAGSAGLLDAGIKIHKNVDNEETKEEYIEKRNSMILEDRSHHFTVDVEELTADEKELEQKLFEIRREIVTSDDSPLFMEVHDAIDAMKVSKLFEELRGMPKGAHLHYHIECPLSVEEFMEFTNDDSVYYTLNIYS